MRTCLQNLLGMPNVTVAIVSGRNLNELMVLLDEPRFIVSGNHGLEIMFATAGDGSLPGQLFEHSDVQVSIVQLLVIRVSLSTRPLAPPTQC